MKQSVDKKLQSAKDFLEWLLPESTRGRNLNRNYLAVASLLLVTLVLSVNLISYFFTKVASEILLETLVLLAGTIVALVSLKKAVKVERVTGIYLIFLTTMLSIMLSFHSQSSFAPGVYFFLVFIMYVSFFATNRWVMFHAFFVVLTTLVFFARTYSFGMALPFHWPFSEYVARMQFVIVLLGLSSYICMVLHEVYKKKAESLLSQEKAWLVRSSRLHEISTLADSLSFQIADPLRKFGKDLQQLREIYGQEGFASQEVSRVGKLFQSVEELIQISRSFDWIYRSHRQDNLASSSLSVLLGHLRVLLEGKALENGWGISVHTDSPDELMQGRIPSLLLIIVTLAHRNFDRYAANDEMNLHIEAQCGREADAPFKWRLSWPKTADKALPFRVDSSKRNLTIMVDEIRESLIEELRKDCGGQLELRASGAWHEIVFTLPRRP